jgi:WD40 repeat protein
MAHNAAHGLSFGPDGSTLATAGWDSVIRFWETAGGQRVREVKVADHAKDRELAMYAVCYAPEGGVIATSHLDGTVRIWQTDTMRIRKEFAVTGRFSYGALTFSPDGLWLATGDGRGSVDVWDPMTGQPTWHAGQHQSQVYTVSFGRDTRSLVSGGEDGVCYLWDLRPRDHRSVDDLEGLWADLAGEDGSAAFGRWGRCWKSPIGPWRCWVKSCER